MSKIYETDFVKRLIWTDTQCSS